MDYKTKKTTINKKNPGSFWSGFTSILPFGKKKQLGSRVSKFKKANPSTLNSPTPNLNSTDKKDPKSRLYYTNKKKLIDTSKIRVFKPDDSKILSEKIKNKIPSPGQNKEKKQFLFGFKNFDDSTQKLGQIKKGDFLKNLNLLLVQSGIKDRINGFISYSIIITLILFLIYLSFFDRAFLVKDYEIVFSDAKSETGQVYTSYLADQEVKKLLEAFNQKKVLGIIPHNQYWFVNDINLTAVARNTIPEIQEVTIKERNWPDGLVVEVKTEPILATVGIYERNQKRYWRVSQKGRIFTEDKAAILENLIFVDSPVTLTSQTAAGKTDQITLQDYQMENSLVQLNRLWFANWLWGQLQANEVEYLETRFPTLLDTDVIVVTKNGTRLIFDSNVENVPREVLTARLNQLLRSKVATELLNGEIAYIDFRLETKRVVICYKNAKCA